MEVRKENDDEISHPTLRLFIHSLATQTQTGVFNTPIQLDMKKSKGKGACVVIKGIRYEKSKALKKS